MSDIRIIDADESHIEEIVCIENECFSMPWTIQQLRSQFTDDSHIFIVAVDQDNKLAGYVSAMIIVDEADINNVAVSGAFRRKGIADKLITEMMSRVKERKLVLVTLEVRESNEAARSLYRKHGFVDVGIRKNYYLKPKENAILMTYNFE